MGGFFVGLVGILLTLPTFAFRYNEAIKKKENIMQMIRSLHLIILCVAVAGCTTSKQVYLPNGQQGFAITCNGGANNWSDCYEKAGNVCGTQGYKLIAQDGESGTFVNASNGNLVGGSTHHRSMMIACGS